MEVATPVTNIRVCSPFPGSRTSYPPQGSRISKGAPGAVINSDIALNDDPPSDSDESVVGEEVHEPVVQVAGIEALPLPVQLGLAGGDQQDVVDEVTVPVVQLPGPGAGGDTLTTVQVVLQHSQLTYGNKFCNVLEECSNVFSVSYLRQAHHRSKLRQTPDRPAQ